MYNPANRLNPRGQNCGSISLMLAVAVGADAATLESMGLQQLAYIQNIKDERERELQLSLLAKQAGTPGSKASAVVAKIREMLAEACRSNTAPKEHEFYTDEDHALACERADCPVPIAAVVALIAKLRLRVALIQVWKDGSLRPRSVPLPPKTKMRSDFCLRVLS